MTKKMKKKKKKKRRRRKEEEEKKKKKKKKKKKRGKERRGKNEGEHIIATRERIGEACDGELRKTCDMTRWDREVVDFTRSRVKNNTKLTNLMKMYRMEGYNGK